MTLLVILFLIFPLRLHWSVPPQPYCRSIDSWPLCVSPDFKENVFISPWSMIFAGHVLVDAFIRLRRFLSIPDFQSFYHLYIFKFGSRLQVTGKRTWSPSELTHRLSSHQVQKPVQNVNHKPMFSSVQPLSHVWIFATPWTATRQASLSITNSRSLLKLMSIESVMPSNHLILCRPLLPPLIFPSISVFSNKSALSIRWPKCQTFSFNISPSNEYSGWTAWISLLSKVLSRAFSNTTVQKYQFFSTQPCLWSTSQICTWRLERP